MLLNQEKLVVDPPFKIIKINPEIDNPLVMSQIANRAYQKNLTFFEKPASDIEISFVYSDEELAAAMPYPLQSWHKAFADKNRLWVFSPTLPKGENLDSHLTHEMAHIFTNQIFGAAYPSWLREGIANVVADPAYLHQGPFAIDRQLRFSNLHSSRDWLANPKYKRAAIFTQYLLDQFGKPKLFQLMSAIIPEIKSTNSPQQFEELFEKYYSQNFKTIEDSFYSLHPKSKIV